MAITEEQRARRKLGLFASDVAAIMTGQGVQVALEKLGEIEAPDLSDVPSVELGNILEAPVLDAWERENKPVEFIRSPDTIYHPTLPWLGCHLDAKAHFSDGGARVVEAKAYSAFNRDGWGEPGTDQVPQPRFWQCMAQMAITKAQFADIPICFVNEKALTQFLTNGTVPIETYVIPRNDELIEFMVEECAKVWRKIEARELPEPINVGDAELIYRRARADSVADATDEIYGLWQELATARAALKEAEDTKAQTEAKIKAFMADAAELRYGGKTLATWKNNKDGVSFDAKAFAAAHPDLYASFTKPKAGARPFLFKE